MLSEVVALVCLGWFIFIALVCAIGYYQLVAHYRHPHRPGYVLSRSDHEIPHVTVIRPCKGHEPHLYECLAATFNQDYPSSKLTVYFCISSRSDAAHDTICKVLEDHPAFDAELLVEDEDPVLQLEPHLLGPNPKVRNMSRAYREAKGDIVWIIDCNVWVSKGVCGRMVDKLFGHTSGKRVRPYKLVHLLPVAVDVSSQQDSKSLRRLSTSYEEPSSNIALLPANQSKGTFGGLLEELFLASSHAKMYIAINTVAVAPCIVGKSTMFRKSQLNQLTSYRGIDYFSDNICEDHLIGDLLWKAMLFKNTWDQGWVRYRNHGLVLGELAIQPVAGMSVPNYVARRIRWLRVRKFTVPTATFVEPGTESFLCSAFGAWGLTTSKFTRGLCGVSWTAMLGWWAVSIVTWSAVDWTTYLLLHSGATIREDNQTSAPLFAKPLKKKWKGRRRWVEWARAWLGREALALPIWTWAIWGGTTVTWRDGKFWVGMDMKVHEISTKQQVNSASNGHVTGGKPHLE